MRDILDRLDALAEATLDASTITKYPERFDAFISHIQDRRPFYTEKEGTEVILDPREADRFLQLKAQGQFRGGLRGRDLQGNEWPLSQFRKTAEFGGASAKPGEEDDPTKVKKEGAQLKPSQIGITDRNITAKNLGREIIKNPTLQSTDYGRAVIEMAQQIMSGQPAVIPEPFRKNEQIKKAIVDYAGEYLGVLALVTDTTEWIGGSDKRQGFLEWLGGDFGNLVLNFPRESNTALADSFAEIRNAKTGHTVSISSKGTGGGAPPSLSSLKVPDHLRGKKEYQTAIDVIDLCQNEAIPSPKTISQVFLMMNLFHERIPRKIPKKFAKFLPWPQDIIAEVKDSLKNGTEMPEYEELWSGLESKGNDGGKLTYVVKKAVMEMVNGGEVPEFQDVVLEILDYNFIQQYATYAGNKTGEVRFSTQWPAKLDGKVTMESKSGGTDPTKGGFSFKLSPPGQPMPSTDELMGFDEKIEKKGASAGPEGDLDDYTRAKRLTGPGAKAARTASAAKTDVGTLGRERRR
jgi:hypothetical protein